MIKYEYRSKQVRDDREYDEVDKIATTCNAWADEGWEVFSILCPDPRNYDTFRLTAKRPVGIIKLPTVARKFR
jgi:hypothetical protein